MKPDHSSLPSDKPALTEAEIDDIMAKADGVIGAAGHVVSDPRARQIIRRKIAGEITGEEADRLLINLEDDPPMTKRNVHEIKRLPIPIYRIGKKLRQRDLYFIPGTKILRPFLSVLVLLLASFLLVMLLVVLIEPQGQPDTPISDQSPSATELELGGKVTLPL